MLVVGAAFFWGTSATLARFAFRDMGVPPLTAVELRLVIAAALFGIWIAWKQPRAFYVRPEDRRHFVILAIFGLAGVQGSYYYAISVLGVSLAILIQYLAPSLLVIKDLVTGKRIERITLIAVVAALAGTILLVGGLDPIARKATPLQWGVAFSACLTFAFYIVYSKRRLAHYAPVTVLFHTFWIAGLVWAVVTPPWRIVSAGHSSEVWGVFVLLALFSTLVPFSLFYAGLKRLPATEAGILSTFEPVVAVVAAAVVLGESLRPLQNVGALLVIAAAAISATRETKDLTKNPGG